MGFLNNPLDRTTLVKNRHRNGSDRVVILALANDFWAGSIPFLSRDYEMPCPYEIQSRSFADEWNSVLLFF